MLKKEEKKIEEILHKCKKKLMIHFLYILCMNHTMLMNKCLSLLSLWQYWLWSFQGRNTQLERFLAIGTQRKSLNFENWRSGEVSKNAII